MLNKSKLFIYFVGFAGIILSMILYTVIINIEHEKITDKFNQNASKIHKIFISTTNQNINTVNFISSIFSNLEVPTRQEFKKIVDTAINFNGVTTGISWNPYFKYHERIQYEQMAKKDGISDFNFIGINKDGKKGISEKKDDYVAVFYIEPFEKNKGALGFDISSNKTRLKTINETKDSGNIAITDRINLVQKDKKTFGALALQAIYKKDSLTNTIEQRRENFKGVIVGVFSFYELGQVVLESFSNTEFTNNVNIKLINKKSFNESEILFESKNIDQIENMLTWKKSLNIANKNWELEITTTNDFLHLNSSNQAGLIFIITFLTTLLLFTYLISEHTKSDMLEKMVEKKSNEIKAQQALLMEQSKMAALGEMIGNIAHQWRQPLSGISTAITGMNMMLQHGSLKKENIESLNEEVLRSTKYLSETIETFRNFIKGDSIKTDIKLCELPNNGITIVQDALNANNIKVINNIANCDDSIILKQIACNEFSHVLINLLNNSKDVILERSIKNAWIKLDYIIAKKNLTITIEDNAGGIPEEILSKIFEPYFTTKHQSKGTGLGLYMSYRLINESMHGKIWAENTLNGAIFYLEIPSI